MKTRSEILAERKKKSAEERTRPLFDTDEDSTTEEETSTSLTPKSSGVIVTCEACESELDTGKLERREDGDFECSECAAPIKFGSKAKKVESKKVEPKKERDAKPTEQAENRARSGDYCGECGAEWAVLNGKPLINCGHMKALRVDDPRKAKKPATVTASGVMNPPTSTPTVKIEGNRLSVAWGKTTFPFGEITDGPKYANFEVPQQFITVDLQPDADRVEEARKVIADLQKIADLVFEAEYTWYKKKLRSLDAK